MRQIGQMAGVSESTVSRILSGRDFRIPIAADTRERVLKLVGELGYTPNPLARALFLRRSLAEVRRDAAEVHAALVKQIGSMTDGERQQPRGDRTVGDLLGSLTGGRQGPFRHVFDHLDGLRALVDQGRAER
jgi:transcriptional regulator with XRE-family HTH domain